MVTREQAVAMARNALNKQQEKHQQETRGLIEVKDQAMARYRSINKENSALREHIGEQQVTIARLSSRVRAQEKAIANLRSEVSNNKKRKPAVVHFALGGRGGQTTRRGGRPAEDEYSEEELLSLDDI